MQDAPSPLAAVVHQIVWQNLADPDLPALECACGRRFVSRRAYADLAAHMASKQPT